MLSSICGTSVALLQKQFCPPSPLPPRSYSTQPLSVGKFARKQLCFEEGLSLIPLFFHWLFPAVSWRRKERDNCGWWDKGDGGGRKLQGLHCGNSHKASAVYRGWLSSCPQDSTSCLHEKGPHQMHFPVKTCPAELGVPGKRE